MDKKATFLLGWIAGILVVFILTWFHEELPDQIANSICQTQYGMTSGRWDSQRRLVVCAQETALDRATRNDV